MIFLNACVICPPSKHISGASIGLGVLLCAALSADCFAQSSPVAAASAPVPQKSSGKQVSPIDFSVRFSSLDWSALTTVQKTSLEPLANTWKSLSDGHKKKWISLTANYPKMSADEQSKLKDRMAQWAGLSPRQREYARLNFAEAKNIAPESKSEKWQAYQTLSDEEKQKLAKSARPKPPGTALAPQPVASNKISPMPKKMHAIQIKPPSSQALPPLEKLQVVPPTPPASNLILPN